MIFRLRDTPRVKVEIDRYCGEFKFWLAFCCYTLIVDCRAVLYGRVYGAASSKTGDRERRGWIGAALCRMRFLVALFCLSKCQPAAFHLHADTEPKIFFFRETRYWSWRSCGNSKLSCALSCGFMRIYTLLPFGRRPLSRPGTSNEF